jgi:hypothetical protein
MLAGGFGVNQAMEPDKGSALACGTGELHFDIDFAFLR